MRIRFTTRTVFSTFMIATFLIGLAWSVVSGKFISWFPALISNPPFRRELSLDIVRPDAAFDPVVANKNVYDAVGVYTATGKHVTLNASKHPILFEAYWCPHCQRTLVMLNQYQGSLAKRPILVSMGFQFNTTLRAAVSLENSELKAFHIHGFKVYYLLDPNQKRYVPYKYPTLVFDHNGMLQMLYGEHVLSAWKEALANSNVRT